MYTQTIKRISFALLAAFILVLSSTVAPTQAAEQFIPVSHFITPTDGSAVTGMVAVKVFMLNGHGQEVVMGVDNNNWQKMDYAGSGRYTMTWNTNPVADGLHTLTARFTGGLDKTAPQPAIVHVYVYHELPPEPPAKEAANGSVPAMLNQSDNAFDRKQALENMLVLAYGEMKPISSHSTAILFNRVLEDSRCPTFVTCFASGAVEVELLVWIGINPEPESIQLRLDSTQPNAASVTLANNVSLTFRWVTPYPGNDHITSEKYVIGLEYDLE